MDIVDIDTNIRDPEKLHKLVMDNQEVINKTANSQWFKPINNLAKGIKNCSIRLLKFEAHPPGAAT